MAPTSQQVCSPLDSSYSLCACKHVTSDCLIRTRRLCSASRPLVILDLTWPKSPLITVIIPVEFPNSWSAAARPLLFPTRVAFCCAFLLRKGVKVQFSKCLFFKKWEKVHPILLIEPLLSHAGKQNQLLNLKKKSMSSKVNGKCWKHRRVKLKAKLMGPLCFPDLKLLRANKF